MKSAIKEELQKDKKAATKEQDLIKAMRCLVCYKKSQDISEALQHAQKRVPRPGNKTPTRMMQSSR